MAMKKKPVRKKATLKKPVRPVRVKTRPASPSRKRPARPSVVSKTAFDAMNERLDIMLPEVIFRIAALEHVLVEKGFCSHDDLKHARQYIQEQEQF